ncbi:efflux RND transporter periplasmic adaptor subunit [Lachnospiraceae bacterium 62-35]
MKKGVTILIGLVIIGLAAGGLYAAFGRKKPMEEEDVRPAVVASNPEIRDITLYTDVIGTIEPSETVSVSPKMSGEVLEVMFEAGQYVEAGQPLCKIDSDALTALRIQVESAQVSMNDANTSLHRMQALFAGGTISQQALEQAQSAAKGARLQYEAAKNQYDLQVKYTTVTAPISGVIESKGIDPHDMISPSGRVCVISAKDQIMVKFSVPERVMKNLQIGMPVFLDKYGTEYNGSITEIASMVDPSSGLYQIKARVDQGEALSTGSKVKVNVLREGVKSVMTIPLGAVSYDEGNPYIYVYNNGMAKRVDIESGIYDMEIMEVKSGLSAGDQVISSWSNELTDGVEVMLVDEDKSQEDGSSAQAEESQSKAEDGAAE